MSNFSQKRGKYQGLVEIHDIISFMLIEQNGWKLDLNLKGGRIVSLKKGDDSILDTFDRGNGKIGQTHLCVPNFANEFPQYELAPHGPSRDSLWELKSYDSGKSAEIVYKMINQGKYPTDLEISQYFELGVDFVHKIGIKNIGNKEALVNLAVHYYFNLDPKKLMLNGASVSDLVRGDKEAGVKEKSLISDGKNKNIRIDLSNFGDRLHFWSGSNDSACVEPVMGERRINLGQIISKEIRLQTN